MGNYCVVLEVDEFFSAGQTTQQYHLKIVNQGKRFHKSMYSVNTSNRFQTLLASKFRSEKVPRANNIP